MPGSLPDDVQLTEGTEVPRLGSSHALSLAKGLSSRVEAVS
jgi:hypothetical protein